MMRGVGTLAKALAKGFLRDRITLFFTILFPLIFLVLFGGIFATEGTSRTEVKLVGQVPLIEQLPPDARAEIDKVLEITSTTDTNTALEEVRDGDIAAAISQEGDRVVVRYSAADQVRANVVRSVIDGIVQQSNLAASGAQIRFSLDMRQVEDESLKAIQYVVPGILGWAIASSGVFGAAFTLVQWREKKLLRRLRLSPVSTTAVVTARVAVSLGVAMLQTAIFIGLAKAFFGLQLSKNWWMAIPVILVGTLAFLSIGLVAGAIAKTEEAANVMANLIILPMAFLSGAFIPLEFSPRWIQVIAEVFPLKHLVTGTQDVLVRGMGPAAVLPEMGILLGFAVVLTGVAVFAFRWDDV